ncbi:hypothetical protein SVIOM342S_01657 [Streptomyces violaceorubidus]
MSRPTMPSMPGTSASRPETVEPNTTSSLCRMPPRVRAQALCTATLSGTPADRAAASTSVSAVMAMSAKCAEGGCPSAISDGPGSPASCSSHTRSLTASSSAARWRTCSGNPPSTCAEPGAWYSASRVRSMGGTDQPSATMWCTVCTRTCRPAPARMSVYRISGPVARSNPARRSRSAWARISSSVMPGRSRVVKGASTPLSSTQTTRPSARATKRAARFGWRVSRRVAAVASRSGSTSPSSVSSCCST